MTKNAGLFEKRLAFLGGGAEGATDERATAPGAAERDKRTGAAGTGREGRSCWPLGWTGSDLAIAPGEVDGTPGEAGAEGGEHEAVALLELAFEGSLVQRNRDRG